jgi:hypothetical protein
MPAQPPTPERDGNLPWLPVRFARLAYFNLRLSALKMIVSASDRSCRSRTKLAGFLCTSTAEATGIPASC